ncbi:MAG: hypothetical protein P9L89_00170 [Candidatus Celaenobacter polaris]|nr:hypothetical protein [Candidatus Celaenobacter polaris]
MNKMILLFTVLFVLAFSTCMAAELNQYGHITNDMQKEDVKYSIENGIFTIRCDGHVFEGNSFFRTAEGYLTLITLEDNVPSILRLYKNDGKLLYEETYQKIINLTLSANREFAAFFDGKGIVVLKDDNTDIKHYPGSIFFAVDDLGHPVYYNAEQKMISYKSFSTPFDEYPHHILFWNQHPVICAKNSINLLVDRKLDPLYTSKNTIFEVKAINSELYFVERKMSNNSFTFELYHYTDQESILKIDEKILALSEIKSHDTIVAPLDYGTIGNPFPIGNSYAEIQQYGSSPYLHPGVDFLGDDFENVYAVKPGYIKAVLTTGGSAYWRIGISNENTSAESEGYLYAHLNQTSIPYTVGDSVQVGDLLGTLYPWGYYDFTHIHFGRITCSGSTWNGNWWTTDNPLVDVINISDTTPPYFENAYGSNLFAFRTESGTYLNPTSLMGEIDIIAKCHDIANSTWKIDVWDLRFKLHPANDPDSTIYERFSFAYDMPLDTYISGTFDEMVLYTLYSRDATCYSIGNYTDRDYYHIITNSDGDSVITMFDQYENLDTSQFPDGHYILEVIARDCSMNETSASMTITFDNVSADEPGIHENLVQTVYPNPFNPDIHGTACISLFSTYITTNTQIHIYNTKGQHIKTLLVEKPVDKYTEIYWDGNDEYDAPLPSGIYFLAAVQKQKISHLRKIIILR